MQVALVGLADRFALGDFLASASALVLLKRSGCRLLSGLVIRLTTTDIDTDDHAQVVHFKI